MTDVDVLIIGSGVAGLSAAIKLAQQFPNHKICLVTKQSGEDSNTRYAQGGISVVTDLLNDSIESHILDTLRAGDGLCNVDVVRKVVTEAAERLNELIDYGVVFDRDRNGRLLLGREGGHQFDRIVHHKDATGLAIAHALLKKMEAFPNVLLLTHHSAIDLLTNASVVANEETICFGAHVLNHRSGSVDVFTAKVTILATGGVGQLYSVTTNPTIATGDGIAMAWRAGAKVSNMEFIQFHPTALASGNLNPACLISEAVRGYGAYLRNNRGERFMFRYHVDGELACRDVVARAIATEAEKTEGAIFIDCTHLGNIHLKFPNIYSKCIQHGFDMHTDLVPIVPAAHYLCGGIDVDEHARTSIVNLYACGECANTGLHGANRLASNSLLEAVVFAHRCYMHISQRLNQIDASPRIPVRQHYRCAMERSTVLYELKETVQGMMSMYAGIVRTNKGLSALISKLDSMRCWIAGYHELSGSCPQWFELRNMIDVAMLIGKQSLQQKENRGSFFNSDLQPVALLLNKYTV